ncbi:MAG: PKD domain-containing protein [Gammaproteobacteria bacterium]|nr:PKD domain-containing protein [Gammaproteobacteria bacterium]
MQSSRHYQCRAAIVAIRAMLTLAVLVPLGGCDIIFGSSTESPRTVSIISIGFEQRTDTGDVTIDRLSLPRGEWVEISVKYILAAPNQSLLTNIIGTLSERINSGVQLQKFNENDDGPTSTDGPRLSGLATKEVTQLYRVRLNPAADVAESSIRFEVSVEGGDSDADFDELDRLLPIERIRTSTMPTAATPFRISAGESHSLALSSDGRVWAWGNNDFNQLDDLTSTASSAPVPVDIVDPIRDLSAGRNHSLAVSTSGRLYSWGSRTSGQLGPGRTSGDPDIVLEIDNAFDVFAGYEASFAITTDLELYGWGNNQGGVLGLADLSIIDTPTRIPVDNVVKVAAGIEHALALNSSGTVYVWGQSRFGRLGGVRSDDFEIRLPEFLSYGVGIYGPAVDIAASEDMSFLVASGGRVLFFGRNDDLLLVSGPGFVEPNVQPVEGIFDAVGVVASIYSQSVIIVRRDNNGNIYHSVAGNNDQGQLTLTAPDFARQAGAPNFPVTPTEVALGAGHGLFVQREGTCGAIWAWGAAEDGRLGRDLGTNTSRATPYPVPGLGSANCSILTVSSDNGGRINSAPGTIDCGMNCDDVFMPGDSVTLDASAQASNFLGFDGDCSNPDGSQNTALPWSLTMDDHQYCPATFSAPADNLPPIATFTYSPASPVEVFRNIMFDAGQSSDPDGSIVLYEWDFDNDGMTDATGPAATFSFSTAGDYPVSLTVTDDGGLSDTQTSVVQAINSSDTPPTAAFLISPAGIATPGTELTFDASSSSDDIGIASWDWDFGNDGVFDASGEIVTYTPPGVGSTDIRLRVTDTSMSFDELIQTVTVSDVTQLYTLTVRLTGSGQVTVTPPAVTLPNQNDCDGDECYVFNLPEGTVIDARANPLAPGTFAGWSTDECDTVVPANNQCEITMTSDRTITALFQ